MSDTRACEGEDYRDLCQRGRLCQACVLWPAEGESRRAWLVRISRAYREATGARPTGRPRKNRTAILGLLATDRWTRAPEIAAATGLTVYAVRQLLLRERQRGAPIVSDRYHGYRLGEALP